MTRAWGRAPVPAGTASVIPGTNQATKDILPLRMQPHRKAGAMAGPVTVAAGGVMATPDTGVRAVAVTRGIASMLIRQCIRQRRPPVKATLPTAGA